MQDGKCALHFATEKDHEDIVYALLEKGGDVNITDEVRNQSVRFWNLVLEDIVVALWNCMMESLVFTLPGRSDNVRILLPQDGAGNIFF